MPDRSATARAARKLRHEWYGTPVKAYLESEAALESTRDHLDAFERQVQRFHSRHFRRRGAAGAGGESFLENHYYDWVTYIVPKIAYTAPRARVRSKIASVFGEDAKALQAGLNRWIRDHSYERFSEDVAIDMQFNWSVGYVSQQPIPGAKPVEGLNPDDPDEIGVPNAPAIYRVLQDLYFDDALARQRSDIRFRGHVLARDRGLLIEEARAHPERGWNLNMLRSMPAADTHERMRRDTRYATDRDEVTFRELWVPEAELEEYMDGTPAPEGGWRANGFNGLILTVSSSGGEEWVRAPRPAYVPPDGPYTVFGCFGVPGSTKSLAPLVAIEEQVLELNAHTRVMSRSAADYKKMAFVENSDPRIARLVRDGQHHGVIPVKGFKRENLMEVEVGGISDQMIAYRTILLDRLNRNSHMDDPTRGKTTGSTAFEADLANRSTETRTEWIAKKADEGHAELLTKALWFMFMDNRSVWPMGAEGAEEMGIPPQRVSLSDGRVIDIQPSLSFRGGAGSNPNSPPFNALEVTVEPFSTRRPNEAEMREQFMAASQFLSTYLPMIPVFPWVRWQSHFRAAAEAFAAPELETIVDWQRATQEGPNQDMVLAGPGLQNPRTGATSPSAKPGKVPAGPFKVAGGKGPQGLVGGGRGRGSGKSAGKASGASQRVGAGLAAV